jgi:hypothetical protein
VLAEDHAAAASPPPEGKLEMFGDIGDFVPGVIDDPVHDPTLFEHRNVYYVFSTGIFNPDDPGGIFARRSTGTLEGPWESLGAIALPERTRAYGVNHLWAPHVVERSGVFYLHYAASSFGSNTSAIGAARTRTPGDLDSWVDLGPILTSDPSVDYNAIDPMVFKDRGLWWITFGSFWDGIKLQQLDDMTTPVGPIYSLARHPDNPPNPIENPQTSRRASITICSLHGTSAVAARKAHTRRSWVVRRRSPDPTSTAPGCPSPKAAARSSSNVAVIRSAPVHLTCSRSSAGGTWCITTTTPMRGV